VWPLAKVYLFFAAISRIGMSVRNPSVLCAAFVASRGPCLQNNAVQRMHWRHGTKTHTESLNKVMWSTKEKEVDLGSGL